MSFIVEPLKSFLVALDAWVSGVMPLPSAISSYAVALILIAIIVKVITYPLNATQFRSMRNMQTLQPKLKALQETHKDDREAMAQAQMELYRQEGVNPLGGCLPMLVQLPILFGLYQAIRDLQLEGALAEERFLWVADLAVCEPNPLCEPQLGAVFGLPIPILLITMTIAQMAYQKHMTPPSTDPQQQAMQSAFKWMPLIFAFMFANLSAALVLYYTAFTVVNIVQQMIMRREGGKEDGTEDAPDGEIAAEAAGSSDDVPPTRGAANTAPKADRSKRHDNRKRRKKRQQAGG